VPPPPPPPPTRTQDQTRTAALDDDDFEGGYSSPRFYQGRTAQWIYGQGTELNTMSASFTIRGRPVGTGVRNRALLQLDGMDSEDAPKTLILVEINGRQIYRGPDPLPNDSMDTSSGNWGSYTLQFDAAYLRQGRNTLTITNLEPGGTVGAPPFFMLDRAYVAWFEVD
jgi:hypothetical protein